MGLGDGARPPLPLPDDATDLTNILHAIDLARQGRLKSIDGEVEDVLPGIDLHATFDTHTWGSMLVRIRNDGKRDSDDSWILAGDNVYCFENLVRRDPAYPDYLPVDLAVGSQTEIVVAVDRMVQLLSGETRRGLLVHSDRLAAAFPSRMTSEGLCVIEIAVANEERTRVYT